MHSIQTLVMHSLHTGCHEGHILHTLSWWTIFSLAHAQCTYTGAYTLYTVCRGMCRVYHSAMHRMETLSCTEWRHAYWMHPIMLRPPASAAFQAIFLWRANYSPRISSHFWHANIFLVMFFSKENRLRVMLFILRIEGESLCKFEIFFLFP